MDSSLGYSFHMSELQPEPHLKRRIGLGLLTAYGVGVMVGAGIYVLVGAVAANAGVWAPLAFLGAGLVAAPSALSYAELATRIPEAAGEAAFVEKGLNSHLFSVLVGLGIVVAGTVSAAAVLRGGTGYLTSIIAFDPTWTIIALGAALTFVAILGVMESLALAALFTVAEVIGLALVIWAGFAAPPSPDLAAPAAPVWSGIGLAITLAFFAFIGFEDIVNMAEETRDPLRVLPRAILWSLVITTALYALVSFAALRAVPVSDLAETGRPLAVVWERGTGRSSAFLSAIATVAALNGVLAQIVMASRVLYGLGRRERRLAGFHHAHARFGTPWVATLLLGTLTIIAALALPVAELAETTSIILLIVFAVVNTALIALKRREPDAPFQVPSFVPWAGLVTALGALGLSIWSVL